MTRHSHILLPIVTSEDGAKCSPECPHHDYLWSCEMPDDDDSPSGWRCKVYDEHGETGMRYLDVRHAACIAAERAAREADVTSADIARLTAMYERVCGENERLRAERDEARALKVPPSVDEALALRMDAAVARTERDAARHEIARLREQNAGLTAAHEKVYAEREEFRTKAMSFMRERDAAMSVGRRLREREARIRALCLHARDTDVYDTPRLELPHDVLDVLDEGPLPAPRLDEKDGEG